MLIESLCLYIFSLQVPICTDGVGLIVGKAVLSFRSYSEAESRLSVFKYVKIFNVYYNYLPDLCFYDCA